MDDNAKRGCVLLADELDFGRGILKLLLHRDYDVLEASDGHEAIARLKKDAMRISCVLLDIKMSGDNGYGVMDYMRDEGLMDKIPVVALTSISDSLGHILCYESGAIDLIEKPYNEEVLLYKIRWNIDRFHRLMLPAAMHERRNSLLDAVRDHYRKAFALESEAEVHEMTAAFLRSFTESAERLRGHEANPDFRAVRDLTHALSEIAANSGASDIADLMLVLNACAKAGDAEATSAAIRRMLALHADYCA